MRPSSPGYTLHPADVHVSMREHGLISGEFSLEEFEAAERHDAACYFGSSTEELEKQLSHARSERQGSSPSDRDTLNYL